MAQVGIREYDAKVMRHRYVGHDYLGFLYEGNDDTDGEQLKKFTQDLRSSGVERRVVKPDQLFGKRGKHGLLGINLTVDEVITWILEKNGIQQTIGEAVGILHTFLAEPLVPHEEEYYVSFETDRLVDRVNFSAQGGVEIEEVWDSVKWIEIPLGNELTDNILDDTSTVIPETGGTKACPESLESKVEDEGMLSFRSSDTRRAIGYSGSLDSSLRSEGQIDSLFQDQELPVEQQSQVTEFITLLLGFARSHGLTYLEVNPFVIQDGKVCCLDMVAKVDTCEAWKQGENRMNLKFVKPFGSESHPLEQAIEALDAETGASLKFSIMNPQGKIGLLLGGGGASVIVMDKLADMGMMNEVVNYGELSGNPSYGDNKAYIEGVVQLMLENNHSKQYLCLMGGIANFTKIDVLAQAYIDALHPNIQNIKDKNIHCIIRRGGPGDTKGLEKIGNFLADYAIPHTIADGDEYLTTVLESIQFSANS